MEPKKVNGTNHFYLLTMICVDQQQKGNSLLSFHRNNGYAQAPEVLRFVDIS